MYSRVTNLFNSQNLIYSRQFGFRKSQVESIRKSLDNGELVCGAFVNLQKAELIIQLISKF